jgi:hypothetical protein
MPRLVAGRGSRAVRRINQALAASDARVRDLANDCRSQAGKQSSSWTRSVAVTLSGPAYFSVVASEAWYCGGAYPDHDTVPHVFDLRSGTLVDWTHLFPNGLLQRAGGASQGVAAVTSDALALFYRQSGRPAAVDPQCQQVIADTPLSFLLWPDAKADGLVLQPSNLPHVIAACGVAVTVPIATLRKLGLRADMLDAIESAHRQAQGGRTR